MLNPGRLEQSLPRIQGYDGKSSVAIVDLVENDPVNVIGRALARLT